jgi:NADH-quinone oxidoreductase subunit M
VFLPIAGALAIAFIPKSAKSIRLTAVLFTLIPFILSLVLFGLFDRSGTAAPQFVEQAMWISPINVQYYLGVDGLSMPMVLLGTFLGVLAVLVSWHIEHRVREYFICLLVLETAFLGVFCSLDLLLFFLFWELELVPMYLLISIWGTGRKEYSAIKFVVYMLVGSAFMLAAILLLYFNTGTWSMTELAGGLPAFIYLSPAVIFFFLLFAFAVKLPVFPLHTWLPDAHTDAPTAVSVILAGILLKMGGYGIIRACVTIFPDVARTYAPLLCAFAVVSVLYGAAVTLRQTDLKRLIAYSSISHMGFVLLGIFALSQISLTGAALQMFSHGLVTGLLFAMCGLVMEKTKERSIPMLGGLARQMPIIAVVFIIGGLAALGLPTTSGFAAEFMVFWGSFTSVAFSGIRIYTILSILGIILTAGYILWMIERVFYKEPKVRFDGVKDATALEMATIFPFVIAIMLIGIYPRILTDVISPFFAIPWG